MLPWQETWFLPNSSTSPDRGSGRASQAHRQVTPLLLDKAITPSPGMAARTREVSDAQCEGPIPFGADGDADSGSQLCAKAPRPSKLQAPSASPRSAWPDTPTSRAGFLPGPLRVPGHGARVDSPAY